MKNISKHITYAEATKSPTAIRLNIDNTPNAEQLAAMRLAAESVFEPLRAHFGVPIAVTSFFRSPLLNKAVRGARNSHHLYGWAMDLDGQLLGGVTNRQIFEFIRDHLDFNELIWEYGNAEEPEWVHVSYREEGNKKEVIKTR